MKPEVYIEDMYEPNDRIALVLVPRTEGAKTQQRIWTAAKAASEPVQRWLRYNNAQGNDIYVSMNPLSPEARGRRKEDIAEVRRVYLDLDKDGGAKLKKLLRDNAAGKIPGPSYLINTSKDRFQVIWNVKPGELSIEAGERLMRGLANEYGGDRAATDVSRVLRLPGFKHRGRDSWIHMSATGQKIAEKKDWPERLFQEPERQPVQQEKSTGEQGSSRNRTGGDTSPSGRDWGQTRDELRAGADDAAIEREIETRRQDKHNPADYAKRTVAKARESLARER